MLDQRYLTHAQNYLGVTAASVVVVAHDDCVITEKGKIVRFVNIRITVQFPVPLILITSPEKKEKAGEGKGNFGTKCKQIHLSVLPMLLPPLKALIGFGDGLIAQRWCWWGVSFVCADPHTIVDSFKTYVT